MKIDICPKGHGLWLDGGEIKALRNRGLVDLKDKIDLFKEIISMAFSRSGFSAFKQKVIGK
ncbi:MAG: zf-TFIIB domain-containing protein [Candidatus Omnitrophica bacterium]|nr:zf-TFIIB domain-containing protein [Candidatus Omnitrophota bacterium]